jgi:hypothetical protein
MWLMHEKRPIILIIRALVSSLARGFPTSNRALPIWSGCIGRRVFAVQDAPASRVGGSAMALGLFRLRSRDLSSRRKDL